MTKITKKIFGISVFSAVGVLGVLGYFWYDILEQRDQLNEQVRVLTENSAKESLFTRTKKLLTETEEERSKLAAAFIESDNEGIDFVNDLEEFAQVSGMELVTLALDEVTDPVTGSQYLEMMFEFTGNKEDVLTFARLFEVAPFHSQITTLTLDADGAEWSGSVAFRVSLITP